MKKALLSISILLLFINTINAQKQLNAYKYIIIPKIYESFREPNKFQLNSLTKFLFDKNGFNTVMEGDAYPSDLAKNPCLGVKVGLEDKSSMFASKLKIHLTDCSNNKVFTSIEGRSKIKEYTKSYQAALRDAFISFDKKDYKYNPNLAIKTDNKIEEVVVVPFKVIEEKPQQPKKPENNSVPKNSKNESVAKSYKNNNISFLLIEQGQELKAYIKSSKSDTYKVGELVGAFSKTSIPKVYRVTWKNSLGKMEPTTAHFDENGNLLIDIYKNGKIEVIAFEAEK